MVVDDLPATTGLKVPWPLRARTKEPDEVGPELIGPALVNRLRGHRQGGGWQRPGVADNHAECVFQQVLRPSGEVIGRAFSSSEPDRRPWTLPDRPKMTANAIEYRLDLLLRKLLDQPKH